MNKKFLTFGILLIVLTGVLIPGSVNAGPDTCPDGTEGVRAPDTGLLLCDNAQGVAGGVPGTGNLDSSGFGVLAGGLFKAIGYFLMKISSLILIISGKIFDKVVDFTVIKMAASIGSSTGVGAGITAAWATLRDIANMCFIFVLLFAAFKNMFQYNINNFGATIKNIIIVALLINFSLFFSKVVIDASNIVSVGFYKSITTANSQTLTDASGQPFGFSGISGGYMRMLGLQTFFGNEILSGQTDVMKIITLGVVSSVFMLITAVILLISGIMFAARFIILIFLMILSPLALIAYIIPGQEKQFNSWKDSLISQSFFAPLFFALTWVVFKVGSSLVTQTQGKSQWATLTTTADDGAITLLLLYILVTGLSIAALVISKQMATSGATGGAFKAISGGMGTAAIGGTALLGRQSVGRAAGRLEKSAWFQGVAARNPKTMGLLYSGTQKAARGSFDVRSSDTLKKAPVIGKEIDILGTPTAKGQGGFEKYREDKTKKVIDKGKQFTDRRARADYARRVASKIGTHQGSTPNNVPSLFGTLGRSNRMAAATLLDERIKELGTNIGSSRSELNGYLNQMGITGPGLPPAPPIADLRGVAAPTGAQRGMLSAHEQRRFDDLIDTAINPATGLTRDSIDGLNTELTNTRTDRTTLGLTNTLRQQY